MSLMWSCIAVLFVGFLVVLILNFDGLKNFSFSDCLFFAAVGMVGSLFLIVPLHFVYLDRQENIKVCSEKGGVLTPDYEHCVKKEVYDAYVNKNNYIKID